MVLAFKLPNGAEMHEPPYTEEEELEFYRRIGGGPVAILHDPEMLKRLEARLQQPPAGPSPSSMPHQDD